MSPKLTAGIVAVLSLALSGLGFVASPLIGAVFAVCLLPAVIVTGLRAGMTARDHRAAAEATASKGASKRTTPKGTAPKGTAPKGTAPKGTAPKGRSVRR